MHQQECSQSLRSVNYILKKSKIKPQQAQKKNKVAINRKKKIKQEKKSNKTK